MSRLALIPLVLAAAFVPSVATADDVETAAATETRPATDERRPKSELSAQVPVAPAADGLTHARAVRRSGSIAIDGRLDDDGWKDAPASNNFVQRFPQEGAQPSQKTEFKVTYDDKAIYVGIRMFDESPDEIRGLLTRRDQASSSDWILVGLDSYHDKRTAFVFGINPANVQRDLLLFNDWEEDASWDAVWTGKAAIDEQGWVAELRIPLSQLRFSAQDVQSWGLQLHRIVARSGEESTWSPWPRSGGQKVVSVFGMLDDIRGLTPGRRLEVLPYLSGGLANAEVADGDPFHDPTEGRFNAGVDVKYGLSSAFTLAATVNPDFGQVEADPSQVNLSANELFFPEKRPFFLEGIDIFRYSLQQGDGGGGEGIFYTRRIGAPPHLHGDNYADFSDTPRETTIYGAAKISGKTKDGLSIGILEAVTGEETAALMGQPDLVVEPLTNFALARVLKDLRGGRTTLAGVVTAVHRKMDTPEIEARLHDQAYTGGVDASHRFGKDLYQTNFKFYGSWVHGSEEALIYDQTRIRHLFNRVDATHLHFDPTRTSMGGWGLLFDIGRQNHAHWNFATGTDIKSPSLELNDMGFQQGGDGISQWVWAGYRDNAPSAQVLNYGLNVNGFGWSDFDPRVGSVGGNINGFVTLANYWGLNGGLSYNHNRWDVALLRGGPAYRDEDGMNAWGGISTDGRKQVAGGFNFAINRRPETDTWAMEGSGFVNVQARSNIELGVEAGASVRNDDHQYVDELYDAMDQPHYVFGRIKQVVTTMTMRGSWTFSPTLSLQLYLQPFIATGEYNEFKQAADTYSQNYDDRFDIFGPGRIALQDDIYLVDADGDGATDIQFEKPDFDVRDFHSNVVVRWEYRPGSTVFFIWSHARSSFENQGRYMPGDSLSALADERGEHVVMVKANYWVGL
jgi:hypothetical protein